MLLWYTFIMRVWNPTIGCLYDIVITCLCDALIMRCHYVPLCHAIIIVPFEVIIMCRIICSQCVHNWRCHYMSVIT